MPDDKIPEGRVVRILCPKCKNPVERADVRPASDAADATAQEVEQPPKVEHPLAPEPSAKEAFSEPDDEEDEGSALELVEEGVKTSLLCVSDDSRSQSVECALRELDFYVSKAATAKTVMAKLHQNRYDLVVLDESFSGTGVSNNLILRHIQLLPMHVRRKFFMCLLSETLPSLDRFLAFRVGVDMILNTSDLDKIKLILVRELKDQSAFYRVYQDELARKGQL